MNAAADAGKELFHRAPRANDLSLRTVSEFDPQPKALCETARHAAVTPRR
jgi:hypothetical protein